MLLRDLGGQLVWTGLLRIPAAALWPSRWVLGVIAALLVGLLGSLSRIWSDQPPFLTTLLESQASAWGSVLSTGAQADLAGVAAGLRRALIEAPTALLTQYPVSTPVLGPLMLGVLVACGGAIARSSAVESATDRRPAAARMLGWSLARWPSAMAAAAVPLAAVWMLILLMRSLGWLGFSLPGVDIAAGLLFPLQALLGLTTVLLLLAVGLAGPMIVPARMIEDSDAIDAMQRSVAYTIAHPLRVLLYAAVAVGVSGLALALGRILIAGSWQLALEQAGAWTGPVRDAALTGVMPASAAGEARALPTTTRISHWLINLWSQIPPLLIGGYAISLFFTAGTKVYLAARQVCDGQDQADIQGEGPAVEPLPTPRASAMP